MRFTSGSLTGANEGINVDFTGIALVTVDFGVQVERADLECFWVHP